MITDGYDSKTPGPSFGDEPSPEASRPTPTEADNPWIAALRPLASLQLTVVLLSLSIFLVLAGTLAQVEMDLSEVIDRYFASPVAWIELGVFFPKSFFPHVRELKGAIPFPGGAMLGILLAVNLATAQAFRFTIRVRGTRLAAGLTVLAAGVLLTYLVIISGSNKDGMQGVSTISWPVLWNLFLVAMGFLWVAGLFGVVRIGPRRRLAFGAMIVFCAAWGMLLVWLIVQGKDARLNDASMRILWQLSKATFAGLVLLGGCVLVFRRRAGLVLMHAGVGLLMFSELLSYQTVVRGQMTIVEGQTVNFVRDTEAIELVVIDPSDPDKDDVVAIPQHMLAEGTVITHDDLPFDVEVVEFHPNSEIERMQPGRKNPATAGLGLQWVSKRLKSVTGIRGERDAAAVYLKLSRKDDSKDLGTYLVSQLITANGMHDVVPLKAKKYQLGLRYKRIYKPYSLALIDFRKDDYIGTDTARNFSSDVRLVDKGRGVDRKVKIWMNNPLRFAGETFYQSSYGLDPETKKEMTILQVVTNTGWMIPYVSCMIVSIGMLYHFTILLTRFLAQRTASKTAASEAAVAEIGETVPAGEVKPRTVAQIGFDYVVPAAIVLVTAAWLFGKMAPPDTPDGDFQIYRFGRLPVVYQGRVKPLDTLARNSLRIISDRDDFKDHEGKRQPAIRWLLDVVANPRAADHHRVFRIQSLELLDTLGLPRRKGFRYSIEELRGRYAAFSEQVAKAAALDANEMGRYERKVLELNQRIGRLTLLREAFQPPELPPLPTPEELKSNREEAGRQLRQFSRAVDAFRQRQARIEPPLIVSMKAGAPGERVEDGHGDDAESTGTAEWTSFALAWTENHIGSVFGRPPDETTRVFTDMLLAYGDYDAGKFNDRLAAYERLLAENRPAMYRAEKTRFEACFNAAKPFLWTTVPYGLAFVLAVVSWLGWSRPLNRASFWLIVFALAVHTAALIGRIYISGRPPVTNPYSSLVFVGWGCVILGLVLEVVFRTGIGNAIGGLVGFLSLLAANLLITEVQGSKGDTIAVQQAVLDTTFWLATHVTTIAFGYSAVFIAGGLGIAYILGGILTPGLNRELRQGIARMIFGTLCFAIFFSFVGTVLGGLWADDAWGRFWGWDPKENGALMIVLWVAVVLHARCAKIVGNRGLAVLAVVGNIATAWAWFGVNELGVGLHSYGFTEGVVYVLVVFAASQLAIIAVGLIPEKYWWSLKVEPPPCIHHQ